MADLSNLWRELLKNEVSARNVFNISTAEVGAEISNQHDRELFATALESIEAETGFEDWLTVKPMNSPKADSLAVVSLALKDGKDVVASGKKPIMFLSKLPDGVFISGTTSKALGRLQADFTTMSVSSLFLC